MKQLRQPTRPWLVSAIGTFFVAAGVSLTPACLDDVENYDCEILGLVSVEICDGKDNDCDGWKDEGLFECNPNADFTPTVVCAGGSSQTEQCGGCGEKIRTCRPDFLFSDWSECDDSCGCDAGGEPTWQSPIGDVLSQHCVRCHSYCRTHQGVQPYVNNGELKWYTERNHFISGSNKSNLLRWIDIDTPEAPCDIPGVK